MMPFSVRQASAHDDVMSGSLKRRCCEDALVKGVKQMRLSRVCSGQLRLKQDLAELASAAAAWHVEQDADAPLQCVVRRGTLAFRIQVPRFYPHTAPVVSDARGRHVSLRVLDNWLSVFTIADVLAEIVQNHAPNQ